MIQVSIPLDEVIQWLKGRRMVPPPSANLQASRGAERRWITWQEEPGGGWRSDGVYGKIFGFSLFSFSTRSLFSITWGPGSGWVLPGPVFGRPSGTRRDYLDESESFVIFDLCSCFWVYMSVLDTGWSRKYSQINVVKYLEASESSKDQLEWIYRTGQT